MTKDEEDQFADELIASLKMPICPKGICERCRDVGKIVKSTCVAISPLLRQALGPVNRRVCGKCAKHLEETWGYRVLRRIK